MGKIFDNITKMIITSTKEGDKTSASTYKLVKAKMLEFKTAKNAKELDDKAEITLINKMIKERKEDIQLFTSAGRTDLAENNQKEVDVLQTMVPAPASEDDIRTCVVEWINQHQDVEHLEKRHVGQILPFVKSRCENAEGSTIAKIINEYIAK